MSNSHDLFRAVQRFLDRELPGNDARRVVILLRDAADEDAVSIPCPRRLPAVMPGAERVSPGVDPEADPPPDPPGLTTPERDILALLRAGGVRLGREEIEGRLERSGKLHGTSTVKNALRLLKARGLVNHRTDSHGAGYGLASW